MCSLAPKYRRSPARGFFIMYLDEISDGSDWDRLVTRAEERIAVGDFCVDTIDEREDGTQVNFSVWLPKSFEE